MKINPKKAMLIGLAAGTLFGTAGCGAANNDAPTVYGPPQDMTEVTTEATTKVEDNELPDVYGPPEDFEK
ncbi:MAG: hypothetical protein K6E28_06745 [Eubacterium sp.]|nr:hypothetical protein [Eubacterium sp.]